MAADAIYTLKKAEDIAKAGRPFYVGYKRQLETAGVLSYRFASAGRPFGFLVFGPGGNGKSRFPDVLAYELGRIGQKYAVLTIPCGRYGAWFSPEDAREQLEQIRAHEMQNPAAPLIVVLDEIDAVAAHRLEFPSGATVAHWTLDLARWSSQHPGHRMVIGICNYPKALDESLLQELGASLYFEPLNEAQATKILSAEGVKEAKDVVRHYVALCSGSGGAWAGRSIGKAMEDVRVIFADEWESMGPEDMAGLLFGQARLVPGESVHEYERNCAWLIDPARRLMDSCAPVFAKLVNEGKLQEILDPDEILPVAVKATP